MAHFDAVWQRQLEAIMQTNPLFVLRLNRSTKSFSSHFTPF
jgi:hypothetical protein